MLFFAYPLTLIYTAPKISHSKEEFVPDINIKKQKSSECSFNLELEPTLCWLQKKIHHVEPI